MARQRDHKQLCDLLTGFLTTSVEEGRQSARSMTSESLALLAPALVNQVSCTTILYVCDSNVCQVSQDVVPVEAQAGIDQVMVSPRPWSADRKQSTSLSKNSIVLY